MTPPRLAVLLPVLVSLCLAGGQTRLAAAPVYGANKELVLSRIEQRLGQPDAVSFDLHVHDAQTHQDWTQKRKVEVSQARINRSDCSFSWHWKETVDGQSRQNADVNLPIALIETVRVVALEQELKVVDARAGHTGRSYRTDPPVYTLMTISSSENTFLFYDPDAADHAAALVAQAVQLCGGAPPALTLLKPQAIPPAQPPPPALAATAAPTPDPGTTWVPPQGRRIALVIGNSAYGPAAGGNIWPDLQDGPHHDADAMAARLRQLGFTVTETQDRDLEQLNADLRQLAGSLTHETLALFYFAGHGTRAPRANGESGEDNYLVPVNSRLVYDYDAELKAVSLTKIRNLTARARAAIVILDACRNDSLRRPQARDAAIRGLAGAQTVTGMLLAYSTAAGEVAGNRPGRMSAYTEALVNRLGRRGETLTTVFRSVRLQLAGAGSSSLPELADALNQDIVLVP